MLLSKGCSKDAGLDSDFKSRDSSRVAFLLLPSVVGKLSSELSLMKDSVFFSSSVWKNNDCVFFWAIWFINRCSYNQIKWKLPVEWQPCSALATVPCLLTPSCQALISWWCVWPGCRRLTLVWHWFSLLLALAPSSGTAVDEMPGPLLADVSMWLQHVGLE